MWNQTCARFNYAECGRGSGTLVKLLNTVIYLYSAEHRCNANTNPAL